ncbi:DUF4231 domain-containing protein [Kitasatospora sp. NPDC047058]|uniref:DUF4231 domain-containing protein n=1 Tax=Kitasatospora sp. NPDC047058 TaxID=3155620 RepID=UPI0033F7E19C
MTFDPDDGAVPGLPADDAPPPDDRTAAGSVSRQPVARPAAVRSATTHPSEGNGPRQQGHGTGCHGFEAAPATDIDPDHPDLPFPAPPDGQPVVVVSGGAGEPEVTLPGRTAETVGAAVSLAAELTGAVVVDHATGPVTAAALRASHARGVDGPRTVLGAPPTGRTERAVPAGGDGEEPDREWSRAVTISVATWGTAATWKPAVAAGLAGAGPVAVVLAGGGPSARAEVLAAVRRGLPVFVVGWSGGLARDLAEQWRQLHRPKHATALRRRRRGGGASLATSDEDAEVGEIIRAGDLRLLTDDEPRALARRISWDLQDAPALKAAWRTFATYDRLASRLRRAFQRFQALILALGVFATLLALIDAEIGGRTLHWVVVVAPVTVSVLIAWTSRRASGQRWIALRSAAEDVKAEIYRHRALTCAYASERGRGHTSLQRRRQLLESLGAIESRLVRTEAGTAPLSPYVGPLPPELYGAGRTDDGLSPLTAERYVEIRVGDQIAYYYQRLRQLDRLRTGLQALAITAGGAGTLLAAIGIDPWIGFTGGLSTAALAGLGYLQADSTIIAYNRAAADLEVLRGDWEARRPHERRGPNPVVELVRRTETILARERSGWVHQMNEALQELRERQEAERAVEPGRRGKPGEQS